MKHIKLYEDFNNTPPSSILTIDMLKPYLREGKYLYHYTLSYNLDDIMSEGIIPRKNPNSHYANGAEGVFLTTSDSLYNANLPQSLMDEMDEYYTSFDEAEMETEESDRPIVRLTIDIRTLDLSKFIWDDDYILNKYNWNKAEGHAEKIIESLEKWRSIAYLGVIPASCIKGFDYDYGS